MRRNHTKQTLNAFSLFEHQPQSRDRAIEKKRAIHIQPGEERLPQQQQQLQQQQ